MGEIYRHLQERCEGQIGNEETGFHTVTDVHSGTFIPVLCEMDEGDKGYEWKHLLYRP